MFMMKTMAVDQLKLSVKFIFVLGFTCLIFIGGLLVALQWPIGANSAVWLVSLNKVYSEMLLVMAVTLLLYSPWWPLRALSGLLFVVYSLTMYTQIASLQFSSDYLPPIALENAKHADFLLDSSKVGWFLIVLLAVFSCGSSIAKQIKPIPTASHRVVVVFSLIIAAVLIKNDAHWLPKSIIDQRFSFYNSGRASIEHKAPGSAMIETLELHYQTAVRDRWLEQVSKELSKESAIFAYDHGIKLNEIDAEYPLSKKLVFDSPPSFIEREHWGKKNMIVFFVEGMSSRIIQPYTQHFPGISPNLEDFGEHATVIDDYYNHSYATYRGLSGQFCSIYANGRLLPDVNYYCLPHALSDNGYDTHFFVSQSLAKTDLDDVAIRAGFDKVHGAAELAELIPDDKETDFSWPDFTLHDTSFIESFKRWLKQRESIQIEQPFFISLYNFQTHTGVRLNSDVKYIDPTGKSQSYVLDTFHNFDIAFGNFWDYFKESAYYENTIIVVTTDHSTFSSKDFSKLVWDTPDYTQVFADRIPLMIYHPDGNRKSLDARNASSVNLAPSLLHTLSIDAEGVPFVGNSIFDESNIYPSPMIFSTGVSYFKTTEGHWIRQVREQKTDIPPSAVQAKPFHDLILYTQGLERDNRLTPARP